MKLIIFDFDGPINDLTKAKMFAASELAEELSVSFPESAIWDLVNYIDQIYETQKIFNYVDLITLSLKRMCSEGIINLNEDQIRSFSTKFPEVLNKNVKLNLSVAETVKEFKKSDPDLKACIYTSQTRKYVQDLLDEFGFDQSIIDRVYDRDSFDEPKPSTKNLRQICKDFDCKTEDVVLIGDNVAIDLAPGHFLGIKTVLVNKFVDMAIKSSDDLKSVLQRVD